MCHNVNCVEPEDEGEVEDEGMRWGEEVVELVNLRGALDSISRISKTGCWSAFPVENVFRTEYGPQWPVVEHQCMTSGRDADVIMLVTRTRSRGSVKQIHILAQRLDSVSVPSNDFIGRFPGQCHFLFSPVCTEVLLHGQPLQSLIVHVIAVVVAVVDCPISAVWFAIPKSSHLYHFYYN